MSYQRGTHTRSLLRQDSSSNLRLGSGNIPTSQSSRENIGAEAESVPGTLSFRLKRTVRFTFLILERRQSSQIFPCNRTAFRSDQNEKGIMRVAATAAMRIRNALLLWLSLLLTSCHPGTKVEVVNNAGRTLTVVSMDTELKETTYTVESNQTVRINVP